MTRLSAKSERRQRLDGPFPLAAMDNLAQALRIGLSAEQAREEASLAFWQAGKSGGRKA